MKLFKALSGNTRYAIVKALMKKKKMTVNELTKEIECSYPLTSIGLKQLRDAHIVKTHRDVENDGRVKIYELTNPRYIRTIVWDAENFEVYGDRFV